MARRKQNHDCPEALFIELKGDIGCLKKVVDELKNDVTKIKTDVWWLKWLIGMVLMAVIGIAFKVF